MDLFEEPVSPRLPSFAASHDPFQMSSCNTTVDEAFGFDSEANYFFCISQYSSGQTFKEKMFVHVRPFCQ